MVTDRSTNAGILAKLLILLVMLEEEYRNSEGTDNPDEMSHLRATRKHQKEIAFVIRNASMADVSNATQEAANYLGFRHWWLGGGSLDTRVNDEKSGIFDLVSQVAVEL